MAYMGRRLCRSLHHEFSQKPIQTSLNLVLLFTTVSGVVIASTPYLPMMTRLIAALCVPISLITFYAWRSLSILRFRRLDPIIDGCGLGLSSFFMGCVSLAIAAPILSQIVELDRAQFELSRIQLGLIGDSYQLCSEVAELEAIPSAEREVAAHRIGQKAKVVQDRLLNHQQQLSPAAPKRSPWPLAIPALLSALVVCCLYVGTACSMIITRQSSSHSTTSASFLDDRTKSLR